jgi:hypothetical protein
MKDQDKEKLDKPLERAHACMQLIAEELSGLAASMKPYAKTQTVQPQIATPIPAGQEVQTVENVEKAFPEDLRELLNFEDKDEYVAIKPRAFLGAENFAKIADIVKKQLNGDYISMGKQSHFRVPKKRTA